jgi:sphinganine-1-phosphate aldolase
MKPAELYKQFKTEVATQLGPHLPQWRLDIIDVVLLTLLSYTILNFVARHYYRLFTKEFYVNSKKYCLRLMLSLPFIKSKIDKKIAEAVLSLKSDLKKKNPSEIALVLPEKGMSWEEIDEKFNILTKGDMTLKSGGRMTGAYYVDQKSDLEENIVKRAAPFLYFNQLHLDKMNGVRQMEAELISFFRNSLNGGPDSVALATTGGTESILIAMVSLREYAKQKKGITQPEMLITESAHAAFFKACFYFEIKVIKIPLDPKTYTTDLRKLKKLITRNTVGVVCSGGNYPHGLVDDIEGVSRVLKPYDIPIHVDCCLGGYSMIFSEELGFDVPKFDFRVPLVTTISIDPHKYGLAPKSISILAFRKAEVKYAGMFTMGDWLGGVYGTSALGGSKQAASCVGAWLASVRFGKEGMIKQVQYIHDVLTEVCSELRKIDGVKVMGNPQLNTFAFIWTKASPSVFQLFEGMDRKKWSLQLVQNPVAIHLAITMGNIEETKNSFIPDFKQVLEELRQSPQLYSDSNSAQIYCTKLKVPDVSILNQTLKHVISEFSVA